LSVDLYFYTLIFIWGGRLGGLGWGATSPNHSIRQPLEDDLGDTSGDALINRELISLQSICSGVAGLCNELLELLVYWYVQFSQTGRPFITPTTFALTGYVYTSSYHVQTVVFPSLFWEPDLTLHGFYLCSWSNMERPPADRKRKGVLWCVLLLFPLIWRGRVFDWLRHHCIMVLRCIKLAFWALICGSGWRAAFFST
jgi:hypothetical protein